MRELLIWKRHPVATRAPNVFFVRPPEYTGNVTEDTLNELNKRIKDLALKAALKKPEWLFLVTHNGGNYSTNLYVFSGDEVIGSVCMEAAHIRSSGYGYRLALTSRIIRNEAGRKNNIGTDNDARALKIMLEKFVPTPLDQLLHAKASLTASTAKQKVYNALHYSSDEALSPERVHGFLAGKGLWEEFAAFATADGADVGCIPERIAAMQVSQRMEKQVNADRGVSVVVHDSTYRVYAMGNRWGVGQDMFVKYTSADLPDNLRGSIGMLKVAEENKVVPDIGVRTKDGFVVTGGVDG